MSTSVTIVTPSYQQGSFIEDTLKSVQHQDYPNLEQWVIDAGSTDQSLDIVKRYAQANPERLKWVSEPDDGQSDAINKGFRKASGDIVAWLNADDVYYPGAVSNAVSIFDAHPEVDVVYGRGTFLNQHGHYITEFPHNQAFDAKRLLNGFAFILQPTVFWRKRVLDKVGYLDNDLHYGMDYDLWCRMAKAGLTFYYDEHHYYAAARFYRETKTASGQWKRSREMARIAGSHAGRPLPAITFFAWLEALMSTRFMTALYRPYKRFASGLDIEYWEIPAPVTSGTYPIHFPWWGEENELTLEIDLCSKPDPSAYFEVEMNDQVVATKPVTGRTVTINLPQPVKSNEWALYLHGYPNQMRFRLRNAPMKRT